MPFDTRKSPSDQVASLHKEETQQVETPKEDSILQDAEAMSLAEETVFDWTNPHVRQQYLYELQRSKYKGRTLNESLSKNAASRVVSQYALEDTFSERDLRRMEQKFRTLIETLYRWQYKTKKKYLTQPQIITRINPLIRRDVGMLLTELEKVNVVVSFMHKNKQVFRLSDEMCIQIDERIRKIRTGRNDIVAEHVVNKTISQSEREKELAAQATQVEIKPDTGDTPDDIFNRPQDYVKKRLVIDTKEPGE